MQRNELLDIRSEENFCLSQLQYEHFAELLGKIKTNISTNNGNHLLYGTIYNTKSLDQDKKAFILKEKKDFLSTPSKDKSFQGRMRQARIDLFISHVNALDDFLLTIQEIDQMEKFRLSIVSLREALNTTITLLYENKSHWGRENLLQWVDHVTDALKICASEINSTATDEIKREAERKAQADMTIVEKSFSYPLPLLYAGFFHEKIRQYEQLEKKTIYLSEEEYENSDPDYSSPSCKRQRKE